MIENASDLHVLATGDTLSIMNLNAARIITIIISYSIPKPGGG
jgi:hypothetical protein